MKPTRRISGERGAMMLELALALPLMVLVIMIVLEGSALVRAHQVLNNAAREGARLAVMQEYKDNTGDITNQVVAYAAENGLTLDPTQVVIDETQVIPGPGGIGIPASRVTVSYSYTMNYLAVFAWLGVPSTYSLQGAAEFRNFYGS